MFPDIELVLLKRDTSSLIMTLDEAIKAIRACVDQMNARYTKTVFDEWAVLSLNEKTGRILNYAGPRRDDFNTDFPTDVDGLRADLTNKTYGVGDFDFARHAGGTHFDAFMVLGEGVFLICNNTRESMDAITKDTRWLGAQVPFVELSDRIRVNPVARKA